MGGKKKTGAGAGAGPAAADKDNKVAPADNTLLTSVSDSEVMLMREGAHAMTPEDDAGGPNRKERKA